LGRRPSVDPAEQQLRRRFARWQRAELRAGRYWAADSCKPWLLGERGADTVQGPPVGFPAPGEFRYSFADLNQDGQLDGLMTFTPEQCDGGNGLLSAQTEVLALSGPGGYTLRADSLRIEQLADTPAEEAGFYQLDSIGPNRLYATYREFGPDDGRCCPGRQQPVVFDFAARRRLR
jgi:hypothetical protein